MGAHRVNLLLLLVPDGIPVCGGQAGCHHNWHVGFPDHNATLFDVSITADALMVGLQCELDP